MMRTYGYLSAMILFSMLIWNASLVAQDDLYFDPSTDEYFAPKEDKYADDDSDGDEYVDEAFDDGDYYYDDDFYYARRIRRFNRPRHNSTFGYYNPWFTNNSYIDPFYYNSGPSVYVSFGNSYYNPYNPYGYRPYGYNSYGYNPYYNPYMDPCYNPYYSSYYGNYGYYGGNPYYNGNAINNPSSDYTYTPPNFGPRRGAGGTVDANGNGRVNSVKTGRGGANGAEEAAPLNYFENGVSGRGAASSANGGRGTISKDPTGVGSSEPSKATRPTRGKDIDSSTEPGRSTKPTRTPRNEPRSTPPRSTPKPQSSTPRSSTPRSSTPRSSSPRSGSGSGSGSKSSGRSGKKPR